MGILDDEALVIASGGARFALPMERVAEVRAYAPETPVPGTPPAIRGVVERNGAPVHVLDPAKRLFGSEAVVSNRACLVFFHHVDGRGAAAIIVDEVERIMERDAIGEDVSLLDVDELFVFEERA